MYLRQSTPRQVLKNRESAINQRNLRDRLHGLGWRKDQILLIDDDQGQSGKQAIGREGFQRLVADVSLRKVGIIMGYEVSRLSRSCADWHRLLELCALFDTLIGDADGIYNPRDFNDRLLLGLKGTLSEAELHSIRLRLDAGRLSKAGRGELAQSLPTGLVRDAERCRPVRSRSEHPRSHPPGLREISRAGHGSAGHVLPGGSLAEASPPADHGPSRGHGVLERSRYADAALAPEEPRLRRGFRLWPSPP